MLRIYDRTYVAFTVVVAPAAEAKLVFTVCFFLFSRMNLSLDDEHVSYEPAGPVLLRVLGEESR